MSPRGLYRNAMGRWDDSHTSRYKRLESFQGAFDVLKSKGSYMKQKIFAGVVVSVLLVGLYLSSSTTTFASIQSLAHDSIDEWGNYGGKTTPQDTCAATPERAQVVILETVGAHDEVDAALIHSIGSQPDVDLDYYQERPRFGIGEIIKKFSLNGKVSGPQNPDDFMAPGKRTKTPDVLILTTCELAIHQAKGRLTKLLDRGKTRLVCIMHHADQWTEAKNQAGVRPWVDQGKIEFWALSPHTADFFQRVVNKWEGSPEINLRVFVPIFPVSTPTNVTISKDELSIAIQGNYESTRRDYKHIFERLGSFLQTSGEKNISLHLLGSGNRPQVPEKVQNHVYFDTDLSYTDFYGVLSRVSAVLPGFSSRDYLDRKASSSVPAALIAGTPLVATQEVVDAYSYVNPNSVWLQKDGESDIDAVARIMAADPAELAARKAHARANSEYVIQGNAEKVGQWIHEALFAIHCNGTSTH